MPTSRRTLATLTSVAVLIAFAAWREAAADDSREPSPCQMTRLINGFACTQCAAYHAPDEVKESEDGKTNLCPKDGAEVAKALFCESTGYQCPDCRLHDRKPAKCKKCGKALEKVTTRAKIFYRCTKCKTNVDDKPRNNLCADCGAQLKQWCACSGRFPHGSDPTNTLGNVRK